MYGELLQRTQWSQAWSRLWVVNMRFLKQLLLIIVHWILTIMHRITFFFLFFNGTTSGIVSLFLICFYFTYKYDPIRISPVI